MYLYTPFQLVIINIFIYLFICIRFLDFLALKCGPEKVKALEFAADPNSVESGIQINRQRVIQQNTKSPPIRIEVK